MHAIAYNYILDRIFQTSLNNYTASQYYKRKLFKAACPALPA